MARLARSELVDPLEVANYHCINRCVRRGYLCGRDPDTGKSYEHRKEWARQRIEFLARYFGIDVTGYSVLSNHFHVVLRSRPDVVQDRTRSYARQLKTLRPSLHSKWARLPANEKER